MFVRDESADITGTGWRDGVDVAPLFLVEALGDPAPGDDRRVYGSYTYRSPAGTVLTLYDWWHAGEEPPGDFWSLRGVFRFSIGARYGTPKAELEAFQQWILEQYQAWLAR